MLRGRGTMCGVPRNRLIRRQVALSLATLLVCLLAWGATGLLAGSGSHLTAALAGLPMIVGVPAPILCWFRGEDILDVTAGWIAPLTAATALLAVSVLLGMPAAGDLARDPLGWFAAVAAPSTPGGQRLAVVTGAAGLALLGLLTALRVRRDLRRYDLTGSRRPPQRVRDAADHRRREREQRIERLRARRRGAGPAPSSSS
jgi:hypothetical protein